MSFFTNLYLASPINPVLMIIVYWIFWPGTMFIVAAVFESRKVYLGKGQSRMFFPGDLTLGVAIVMFIGMHAKNPIESAIFHSPIYWIVGGIFHAFLAFMIRIPDIKHYPLKSRNSPTKIAHDFCGYFICAWMMAALGIPQLIWCVKTSSFGNCITEWVIFMVVAAFFLAMGIWDATYHVTSRDLLLRHPDKYRPIWKKN